MGIIADSDRFLLSYTTPKTFNIAARLLNDYKFELTPLYNNLYERGINERRFESYIIENINISENGFGYIKITDDIIKKYDVDSSTASNLVNDLNLTGFLFENMCIRDLKIYADAMNASLSS